MVINVGVVHFGRVGVSFFAVVPSLLMGLNLFPNKDVCCIMSVQFWGFGSALHVHLNIFFFSSRYYKVPIEYFILLLQQHPVLNLNFIAATELQAGHS